MRIAQRNQLKNCPITPRDVRLMKEILGPSIPGLKGKTVRTKPAQVNPELIPVPPHIRDHYQTITLAIDIMFVNRIPFLMTTSRHIHYHTASALPTMQITNIVDTIRALHKFYLKRDFRIIQILADGQFHPCKHEFAEMKIDLNCVAHDEHVPEAERLNRTVKERCRCNYHMTPFTKIPRRMVIGLIRNVIFYLNAFPHEDGVSADLSPYTIINGKIVDYNLHCRIPFGTYAQTRNPTENTMRSRTTGAIAMGPSSNYQGGVIFFSLTTGKDLDRSGNDFTIAPMPDDAIQRVEHMAAESPNGLLFADRHNNPFDTTNSGPITIRFTDPPNGNIMPQIPLPNGETEPAIHQPFPPQNQEQEQLQQQHFDPDNQRTIRITGVDDEPIESAPPIDDNDDDELDADELAHIETPGVESNTTEVEEEETKDEDEYIEDEYIESTGVHEPRRSNRLRNLTQQFEYQYLQGTFDDGGKDPTIFE